jgi:L-lactate dehydrogenase complex protein LldG
MSARDEILARVRKNHPAAHPLPAIATFERPLPPLLELFQANLARMGGDFFSGPVDALLREKFAGAKVICSATPEVAGDRRIEDIRDPQDLEDVDVGVVRAAFAVAETGSVFLSEKEFGINALGFLSQHLVVLLDPGDIVANLHHAYAKRAFREAAYAVLMSGPSATADIEGVLVRGAQGIRSLTVVASEKSDSAGAQRGV